MGKKSDRRDARVAAAQARDAGQLQPRHVRIPFANIVDPPAIAVGDTLDIKGHGLFDVLAVDKEGVIAMPV